MVNNCVERILRACEYINHNLDEQLTLEEVCKVAAFSKYHFHRVFSAYVGMSVSKYVSQAKLKRASFRLAFEGDRRLIDIAFEAGFESPEAFSRAFKRTFLQSPSSFRVKPDWRQWHACLENQVNFIGEIDMQVRIENFIATKVALIEHLGPVEGVLESAGKFIQWRKETGLSPIGSSATYGIAYSDPKTTEPAKFRWDVCGSITGDVPQNDYGVKLGEIPAGRCAVIQHVGSHDSLEKSIYYFYREWLPKSAEKLRDYPCYFHYLNLIHEVDECDLLTDIYFPLRERGDSR